jgi:hypothetical protein
VEIHACVINSYGLAAILSNLQPFRSLKPSVQPLHVRSIDISVNICFNVYLTRRGTAVGKRNLFYTFFVIFPDIFYAIFLSHVIMFVIFLYRYQSLKLTIHNKTHFFAIAIKRGTSFRSAKTSANLVAQFKEIAYYHHKNVFAAFVT